jgi:hypothetical protein
MGNAELLGFWYFHMGANGYLKLQLKSDHAFNVSVIACSLDKEERKPGGKWSLNGGVFQLIWPDGAIKTQELVFLGNSQLKLTSRVGYELYHRVPTGCESS